MSKSARTEVVAAVTRRYLEADRREKAQILDEFVQVTGYHRKYALRVLHRDVAATRPRTAGSVGLPVNQTLCVRHRVKRSDRGVTARWREIVADRPHASSDNTSRACVYLSIVEQTVIVSTAEPRLRFRGHPVGAAHYRRNYL